MGESRYMEADLSPIIVDIETCPLPEEQIAYLFDADRVKVGNIKDPAKIAAKIEDARMEFLERAALSPDTGRVLALAVKRNHEEEEVYTCETGDVDGEAKLLETFWEVCMDAQLHLRRVSGWNFLAFDLPFLIKRTWILGGVVPFAIKTPLYRSEWWGDVMHDYTLDPKERCGLLRACRVLNIERSKIELDCLPYHLAENGEWDRLKEYAAADVAATWEIHHRIRLS